MTTGFAISSGRRLIVALTALVALALTLGMTANADAKKLGETTLKPNTKTFEALSDLGVSVTPLKPAKAGADGIAFPITGAELDRDLTGKIEHRGGLEFAGGGAELAVKDFLVKIGKEKSNLFAYAGKTKVKLLSLDLSKAKVSDKGATVSRIKASLAKPGAEALSQTFGTEIPKGTPIGKVTVAFE